MNLSNVEQDTASKAILAAKVYYGRKGRTRLGRPTSVCRRFMSCSTDNHQSHARLAKRRHGDRNVYLGPAGRKHLRPYRHVGLPDLLPY